MVSMIYPAEESAGHAIADLKALSITALALASSWPGARETCMRMTVLITVLVCSTIRGALSDKAGRTAEIDTVNKTKNIKINLVFT
jgi:hypothetical protein